MWVGDSPGRQPEKFPLFCRRLRDMGVNTAMVYGNADPAPLWQNHFPYYVENMVNRGLCLKWNSNVRDWEKLLADWNKDGRSKSELVRDFCLEDPQWRAWAREEVRRIAVRNGPHQPLAYNLRDELSTTYSANPFDYDFNPIALAAFRHWLKTQYASLAALNAEWETGFAQWDDVTPFTTDEIKNRMAGGQALPRGKPDWQELEALKFDPISAQSAPLAGIFRRGPIFAPTWIIPWQKPSTIYVKRPTALIRKRQSALKARKCPMPLAATICGGFRARWIGSSHTTSGTRGRYLAPSCPGVPSSRPFLRATRSTRAAASGICCSKEIAAALFGGARIAWISKAPITL
jgi:hypothetical protein